MSLNKGLTLDLSINLFSFLLIEKKDPKWEVLLQMINLKWHFEMAIYRNVTWTAVKSKQPGLDNLVENEKLHKCKQISHRKNLSKSRNLLLISPWKLGTYLKYRTGRKSKVTKSFMKMYLHFLCALTHCTCPDLTRYLWIFQLLKNGKKCEIKSYR